MHSNIVKGSFVAQVKFTLSQKLRFLFSDFLMYLPLLIEMAIGYGIMIGMIVLSRFDIIPSWIASPLAIAGWCYANYLFWCHRAWRSSGPRARFINPLGPSGSDAFTTVLWLLFGVFFHCYHVWLRSGLRYRKRDKEE